MIANIKCLTSACDELKIPYKFVDSNNNFVKVIINKKSFHFINTITPFNTEDIAKLSRDKYFSYLAVKNIIKTPRTINFLDPKINKQYKEYLIEDSYESITNRITNEFNFPIIVKRNAGFKGINVFKCLTKNEVLNAVKQIFNRNSKYYDFAAIAQEYVNIKKEYRVITFKGKILLCYRKFYYKTVTDEILINKIKNLITPLYKSLDLNFAGLDIAIDEKDNLWLIEINTAPGLEKYTKKNGDENVINLYRNILQEITHQV